MTSYPLLKSSDHGVWIAFKIQGPPLYSFLVPVVRSSGGNSDTAWDSELHVNLLIIH